MLSPSLVYHWVKYVKKSVSFIFANGIVENWSSAPNGTVYLEATFQLNYTQYRKDPLIQGDCEKFMCDFKHFTGKRKPWLEAYSTTKDEVKLLWWNTLLKLNDELGMSFNASQWQTGQRPPLGYFASIVSMDEHISRQSQHRQLEHGRGITTKGLHGQKTSGK